MPFNKLGDVPRLDTAASDCRGRKPYPELLVLIFLMPLSELLCFDSRLLIRCVCRPLASVVEVDSDRGLGGRLLTRAALGGCGNAPILVVFRIDFVGDAIAVEDCVATFESAFAALPVLSVGTAGVE